MRKCLILLCLLFIVCLSVIGCAGESERNDVDFDVDLTSLSSTMVQAEYERIVSNSEDYIGKTIRASGTYRIMANNDTGDFAHYIIIVQGDDCCQMGFEFKRDGDFSFPGDYPKPNAVIEITGVLDTHKAFGASYLYIEAHDLTF